MKSRIVILVLLMISIFATGCGGNESNNLANALEISNEEADELAEILEEIESEEEENDDTEEIEVNEVTTNIDNIDIKMFDESIEWESVTLHQCGIQIDDTLFVRGKSMKEMMEVVQNSSINYDISEYNPDRLVDGNAVEALTIYRDEIGWIIIYVFNASEEKRLFEELPVIYISATESSKEYCYYLDGSSYEELIELTYDEVLALEGTTFLGFTQREVEANKDLVENGTVVGYSNLEIVTEGVLPVTNEETLIEEARWSGYEFYYPTEYQFVIDNETGEVVGFYVYPHSFRYNKAVLSPLTSISEITAEEMTEMEEEITIEAFAKYQCTEVKIIGYYLEKDSEVWDEKIEFTDLVAVVEITKSDESKTYAEVAFERIGRNFVSGLDYKELDARQEKNTLEDAFSYDRRSSEILENTFE